MTPVAKIEKAQVIALQSESKLDTTGIIPVFGLEMAHHPGARSGNQYAADENL